MEIKWNDVCDRMKKVGYPREFAKKHGLGMMTELSKGQLVPPNADQEAKKTSMKMTKVRNGICWVKKSSGAQGSAVARARNRRRCY
jgi:hypothetical protein